MSGAQLQDKALAATREATSLRVRVHDAKGGVDMDITVDRKGQCRGSMSQADGTISYIRTTDIMFFKPNEAFVRRQWAKGLPPKEADSAVAQLAGRWSKVRTSDPWAAGMGRVCNMKSILGGFASTPLARTGKPTSLNGQPVLTVTVPRQGRLDTWYIAAEGAPYLLKLTTGGSSSSTEMSAHNQPVDLTPPEGKVQDLT